MANFRDTLTFKNYDRERIIIDSIAARLTAEENGFRNKIIHYIVDHQKPFAPADEAEQRMVETLRSKNALAIEEDGTVYCMCAIDALGCAYTRTYAVQRRRVINRRSAK